MKVVERFADRYAVVPDLRGPRIRLGVLWAVLMFATSFAGEWYLALFLAATASAAALQIAGRWHEARVPANQPLAAVAAALIVLAAAVNNTVTGIMTLVVVAVTVAFPISFHDAPSRDLLAGVRLAWGTLAAALPAAVASAAAVQLLRIDVMAFLFVAGAACTYDAGDFLCNGGPRQRLVGPAAGMAGVAVVTAAMFFARPAPFSSPQTVVVGVMMMLACPIGQFLGSWLLPRARTPAPALRRLDSWLISAPVALVAAWIAQR